MIKIALAGVFGALLGLILKKDMPGFALAVTVTVVSVLCWLLLSAVEQVLSFLRGMAEMADLADGLFLPVIKCVGIAIVTRLASDMCRDAKETAIASAIELAGTAVALYLTLPLFTAVIKLVRTLV